MKGFILLLVAFAVFTARVESHRHRGVRGHDNWSEPKPESFWPFGYGGENDIDDGEKSDDSVFEIVLPQNSAADYLGDRLNQTCEWIKKLVNVLNSLMDEANELDQKSNSIVSPVNATVQPKPASPIPNAPVAPAAPAAPDAPAAPAPISDVDTASGGKRIAEDNALPAPPQ